MATKQRIAMVQEMQKVCGFCRMAAREGPFWEEVVCVGGTEAQVASPWCCRCRWCVVEGQRGGDGKGGIPDGVQGGGHGSDARGAGQMERGTVTLRLDPPPLV